MQRKKKRSIIFELHSIPIKIRSLCKKACSLIHFSSGRVPQTRRHGSRPLILGRDLRKPSEKVLKEHSNLSTKRLYLVSYSIPLSLLVVLLLGLNVMINPGLFLVDKSSAVTVQDEWVVKENDISSSFDSETMLLATFDSPLPASANTTGPSLSLAVSNTEQIVNAVQGGKTVYGAYDVTLIGHNVLNYTLSMKASSSNLTMPTGVSSSTSAISGAGGKSGSSMVANTWGYNFADASASEDNYNNLSYATLPTTDNRLAGGDVTDSNTVNLSKKLIFAAKFAEAAAPGLYSASITLSAAATPAIIGQVWSNGVDSEINTMQEVTEVWTQQYCNGVGSAGVSAKGIKVGDTLNLRDVRDDRSYNIVKLEDGACWMQEDLKLEGQMNLVDPQNDNYLTPEDSDVTARWRLPATLIGNDSTKVVTGWVSAVASSARFNDTQYGVVYDWYAATAESGKELLSSGDGFMHAQSSICPKGWHLPSYPGDGIGSFNYLFASGQANITDSVGGSSKLQAAPYNFKITGFLDATDDGSSSDGEDPKLDVRGGRWWTNTVYRDKPSAYTYYLNLTASTVRIAESVSRSVKGGYSVRCVATY